MNIRNNYSLGDIDDGSSAVLAGGCSCLLRHKRPQSVNVDCGSELLVPLQSESPHTALAEVPGVAAPISERGLTICSC